MTKPSHLPSKPIGPGRDASRPRVLSLSDNQLDLIKLAAGTLDLEKRSTFLQRCAGILRCSGHRPDDYAVSAAVRMALHELLQGVDEDEP
jgi:hypothetical protein